MRTKCLISYENEVMYLGLRSLLWAQSDLDCIGMQFDRHIRLKPLVDQIHPDVLIIDKQSRYYPHLPCLLAFAQFSDLVVIVFNIEGNQIQIYQRGEVVMSNTDHLIAAIRSKGRSRS